MIVPLAQIVPRSKPNRWVAVAVAILCVAAVTTLNVTTPGLWIARAAQRGSGHEYRVILSLANGAGALAVGVAARLLPLRLLGLALTAAYTLLMMAALVTGALAPALSLPLAAAGGGLGVCVWSQLLQQVANVPKHRRSAAVLLGEIVVGVGYVFALGALSPLLSRASQRASFALAAAEAGLVIAGMVALRTDVGAERAIDKAAGSPNAAAFAPQVALLFLLAVPAQIAAAAMTSRLNNPLDVMGFHPWLQSTATLVAAGGLLALFGWLSLEDRAPTIRVVALGLLCGAGLSSLFLVSLPSLHAAWGVGPAFLVALGSGVASLSTTPLLVLASVVTPRRLVPLLVAGWFVKNTIVTRWVAPLAADAPGDAGRTITVTLLVVVLLAVSALTAWSLGKRESLRNF